jgi:hypothetical protein
MLDALRKIETPIYSQLNLAFVHYGDELSEVIAASGVHMTIIHSMPEIAPASSGVARRMRRLVAHGSHGIDLLSNVKWIRVAVSNQ